MKLIIGGHGPAASSWIHQQIITLAQLQGAVNDEDYPEFIITSITGGGLDEKGYIKDTEKFTQFADYIKNMFGDLGEENIFHACNSLKNTPIIGTNLLDVVTQHIEKYTSEPKNILILTSERTRVERLYDQSFDILGSQHHISYLDDQQLITDAINNSMAGKTHWGYNTLITNLNNDIILLGCTELHHPLSTIYPPATPNAPWVIDGAQILAHRIGHPNTNIS